MPEIIMTDYRKEERLDAATPRVTRKSRFSGAINVMELPLTAEQWAAINGSQLIQQAAPHLTGEQREFLLTGTTQAEWDKAFPPEEDED